MALNLDKLIKERQFRLETDRLGELVCHNFSTPVMSEAGKWLEKREGRQSDEFVRYLSTLICQPVAKEEDKNYRIDKAQSELLESGEIEEFSRLFIEKNKYLLNDKEKQETLRKKDDDGRVVVSFKDHISEDLLKKDGESDADHLLRVVEIYIKQSHKRAKKLFESATKNQFSSSTLDLIKENMRISDSLGSTLLHSYEPLKFSDIPENPVHETNRHLASFGKELNDAASLVKNMNDLGVQMAMESGVATAQTKFWNNVMFILGLITLVVSAVLSYLSFSSTNASSIQAESLLNKQNLLLIEQKENQQKLIDSLSLLPFLLEKELAQVEAEKQILNEISAQLTSLKSQSSSQSRAARSPQGSASD